MATSPDTTTTAGAAGSAATHTAVTGAPLPVEKQDARRVELTRAEASHKLGFSWSASKKWTILTVIFVVQCSMNFNAAVYSNTVDALASAPSDPSQGFGVSKQTARLGQCVFLLAYAFGCELWAPWSEEIGRWPVLQLSLFFVNVWQILCACAPNFASVAVGRALGGLSSAGGSVTLGMIADMWKPEDQQFAVAYVVLSSVGGSVLGPIFGGLIQQYLPWRWNFWIQLIFGVVTQVIHFFVVPETRETCIMDKEAKRLRKSGERPDVYGPNEIKGSLFQRMTLRELVTIWVRPFHMFLTEPIVLCLSLLSGFSDALIFTFLDGFSPVFKQWGFTTITEGVAFASIMVGYVIAYVSFLPFFVRDRRHMAKSATGNMAPERRLYWLLWTAPLEAIGLFGFAWCSLGPSHGIHWFAPLFFASLVGIANVSPHPLVSTIYALTHAYQYAIYMATIDYMVAAYGPYAASATGGNGFSRDFLAGIAALYSTPFYNHFKTNTLELPSTVLACIAVVVTVPIYVFYWYGPAIRERSPFACTIAKKRAKDDDGDEQHEEVAAV